MPKILMRKINETLVPANAEAEAAFARIPRGRVFKTVIDRPRSTPAHNMFFGVIAAATEHWPAGADPEPDHDAELLRAWLLCRIGHCDKIDFPYSDDELGRQMSIASVTDLVNRLRARGEHPFIRIGERTIEHHETGEIQTLPVVRVFISRTIAKEHLDEAGFIPIRDRVYEEIETIVGVPAVDLLRQTEAAA